MSVVPALKTGRLTPKFLVNIKGIGGSSAPLLDAANAQLTIGALVRHREVETSPVVAEHLPALRALEERLASVQIRNHGTLAGNLCAAEPWSDPPCLLAALDANLVVVDERGERRVSAADWILGEGETLRRPGELLLRIDIPLPAANVGIGHARVAAREGLARPLACAAARITLSDSGTVKTARVFIGAVGPRPQRMTDVEAMLVGHRQINDLSADIEHAVSCVIELHPDERCGARYKTQVAGVLVRRAVTDAIAHANRRVTGS
jgi:carbon-monoxide dehydrogenase medium subunit